MAIVYGASYGGKGLSLFYGNRPYQPGDCILQSSAISTGYCDGSYWNTDLYIKRGKMLVDIKLSCV